MPQTNPSAGPLAALRKPEVFASAVDLAARRDAMRAASHAVVHGRIDQIDAIGKLWSQDTQTEVREHVAAVMRASLRRGDRMAHGESDAFTITLSGADERAAVRIANRLRRRLARLHLPQLGSSDRLTASFGVAAARAGDGGDRIVRRARRALEAAMASGADHVVPASDIEEIMLLPAPSPLQASAPSAA